MRLEGKIAIVTGGGRGIGRAIALALAREGADVVVSARTRSEIEAVADEIRGLGRKALVIPADVTVAQEVEQLVEQTLNEFGHIDILVNSAGGIPYELYDRPGPFRMPKGIWETEEATWDRIIASNLKSVFLCMKAVLPHMIDRGQGDIVNIASRLGREPTAVEGSYPAAKHAVISLTQTTALQTKAYGIRVNAVSPGMVDTPGQRRFLETFLPGRELPPMMSAESVAAAVVYLLCDTPREMTGQSIDLFGIG
ncbi:MAG: SDR family oxidoreductase [Chloroflexi bacterium]|nr:SDR family oxidoreductase [Chloroflexota bacterium]